MKPIHLILAFILLSACNNSQKKAKDQIGYVFLGIMTVKVIAAYIFIAPALELKTASSQFEKNNFFIYFLTFLAIDVYLTAQILNKKN